MEAFFTLTRRPARRRWWKRWRTSGRCRKARSLMGEKLGLKSGPYALDRTVFGTSHCALSK